MNVKELLAAIEAHAEAHGRDPIYLPEMVWHAAKQAFLLGVGECSMFPVPGYPTNFGWRGVPVVLDHEGRDDAGAAAAQIVALATVAGPDVIPAGLHAGAPEAKVLEGQPRPELDLQVPVEHFAGEDGVFAPPVPADLAVSDTALPVVPNADEPEHAYTGPQVNDPDAPAPEARTAEELPEPTGFAAMSQKAGA